MSKHKLTNEDLDYLVWRESVKVDKTLIEKLCRHCGCEPICYFGMGCQTLREKVVKRLKTLSSEELTELVFNKDMKLK